MAYIEVIQLNQSKGRLREIYNDLIMKRGKLAEVHKIQSLNPESIVHHMDLYLGIMFGSSPLKRYQREMIAVVVSSANNCKYCVAHHGEALNHFWKNEEKVKQLADNFIELNLPKEDLGLCEFAHHLTRKPWESDENQIQELRDLRFDDRAILDSALVIAYFNFVNRMVLALGAQLETQ